MAKCWTLAGGPGAVLEQDGLLIGHRGLKEGIESDPLDDSFRTSPPRDSETTESAGRAITLPSMKPVEMGHKGSEQIQLNVPAAESQ